MTGDIPRRATRAAGERRRPSWTDGIDSEIGIIPAVGAFDPGHASGRVDCILQ
jgi:hypothetical protein